MGKKINPMHRYNRLQAKILKALIDQPSRLERLNQLTQGKHCFVNVYDLIYKSIALCHKKGCLTIEGITATAKDSKLGKQYTKAIDEAMAEIKAMPTIKDASKKITITEYEGGSKTEHEETQTDPYFCSLVATMVYFANSHKGAIKDNLTAYDPPKKTGMASQKQINLLEYIRKDIGKGGWLAIKADLGIIRGGTILKASEASAIIDKWKLDYNGVIKK